MRTGTLFTVWLLAMTPSAQAQQCGARVSQCRTCHEVRGARPVLGGPLPWHIDHAFADYCARCHGGEAQSSDAALAHVGVMSPLSDVAGRCGPCHGASSESKAARYRTFVSTARSMPPAPPAAAVTAVHRIVWGNVALSVIALALALGGVRFIVWNERRLGARGGGP